VNAVRLFVEPYGNPLDRSHLRLSIKAGCLSALRQRSAHHAPIPDLKTSHKKFNSRLVVPTQSDEKPVGHQVEGLFCLNCSLIQNIEPSSKSSDFLSSVYASLL
jgi:hypothetical protein